MESSHFVTSVCRIHQPYEKADNKNLLYITTVCFDHNLHSVFSIIIFFQLIVGLGNMMKDIFGQEQKQARQWACTCR